MIYEVVLKGDIVVDRAELISALEYDRNQFRIGYECGKLDKEFTIDDLKRALVDVRTICKNHENCDGCPFNNERKFACPLNDFPARWKFVYQEEDTHEAD